MTTKKPPELVLALTDGAKELIVLVAPHMKATNATQFSSKAVVDRKDEQFEVHFIVNKL